MDVAIITAGGAGMFCGSCMHDNTWARALRDAGVNVTLIPTYTFGVSNDAAELGELTLDMLDGELGSQRRDVEELVSFIANDLKPDVVCFSNALLAGAVRSLRQKYDGKIVCTLQGDDIFLDGLSAEHRQGAIDRISSRAADFDGFLVHSDYYRDHMAAMLKLPGEKFARIPLGIDFSGFSPLEQPRTDNEFRIGYFARICPEKGLHVLVEAVRKIRKQHPDVKLIAGGYLGSRDATYFERVTTDAEDLGDAFEYIGSPADQSVKARFLQGLDVLSVPAPYKEPKGIYILEALACGVPVVQPAHGAYPEMLATTQGGLLFEPGDVDDLAEKLSELIVDSAKRTMLATQGNTLVREHYSLTAMTNATVSAFEAFPHNATDVISVDPDRQETP